MNYCMVHSAFKTSCVCIVNEANFRNRECNKNNIIHPHTHTHSHVHVLCDLSQKKFRLKFVKQLDADPHTYTHTYVCRAIERVFNSATETGSR